MPTPLPTLFLARHSDTAWTESHRHTGRTDIPLNERGEDRARQLGTCLRENVFDRVFTSPLQRARRTCELAGFARAATGVDDLLEWDYGVYEGKTTAQIQSEQPGWELFRDGCPGGEDARQVAERADRFIRRVREVGGNVLAFSSGHIGRMIAARWLGLTPVAGRAFYCDPGSLGQLGFEHQSRDEPIVRFWNQLPTRPE